MGEWTVRILSWNCRGGLQNKFSELIKVRADLYLIQEVGNGQKWLNLDDFPNDNYLFESKNGTTHNDKNGILAFSLNHDIRVKANNNLFDLDMRYYQYLTFGTYDVLNVWTHAPAYIEDLYSFIYVNQQKLLLNKSNTVIMGDFNSNVIWSDHEHKFRNHDDLNTLMEKYNFASGYHEISKTPFGQETDYTFRQKRRGKINKYYIDYAYTSDKLIQNFEVIHNFDDLSDHSAILIEVEN